MARLLADEGGPTGDRVGSEFGPTMRSGTVVLLGLVERVAEQRAGLVSVKRFQKEKDWMGWEWVGNYL